jgi:anti-anti-sigma regulatory factor
MLRIDESDTLKLEGRIVGPWTVELRDACERVMGRAGGLVLDLGGVDFVDREAAALLRQLRSRGARLVNASPFLAELLKDAP